MSSKKDNVVILPVISRLPVPPSRVLKAASAANLTEVVIIGYDADGEEYFASSQANGAEVLWHLKRAEYRLLSIGGGEQ